ncbi:MAG: hypothetical protein WCC66_02270 [Rhizobiaceae bacterium]
MFSRTTTGLLAAAGITLMFVLPASAEIDAKKVTDAIAAQFAGQGLPLTIESAELSGANIIAKGVSLKLSEAAEGSKIGDVVLENVSEEGAGYLIGKISAPATTVEDGTEKFVFSGASISNVHVAGPGEPDPVKQLFLYETMDVGPISFTTGGAEVFKMAGAKATMSPYTPGQAMNFDATVDGLFGDLSKIPDPKTQEAVAALGYGQINGKVTMKGSWNPTDGRMTISEGAYDFADIGRLNVTMDISGYTPELVKGLQEMNKSLEGQSEEAKGLAMLGLIQQLNFISMSIRFDDASVTGRVIDYAAKQAGQPRDAIIAQSKAIIPFAVAQLKDPDFAAKVTAAASAYMDNPKSLEIKAAPAAPIPFALLIATGSTTPEALIKQLGVTVTANE